MKGGGIHFDNFQVCLMLQDDGSQGWPHSGEAYITQQGTRYQGVFVVIGSLLSVTIGQGSSNGELASFELNAPAANGAIGAGLFEEVEGEALPTGVAAFGAKNGC